MAFDAFISYSHAADGRLAPALQRAMQRLAKPWYRTRALRVFRDESALSANPHLWSSIQTALDESEWFVLLASPDAVGSQWVNRELEYWLATKSANHLLPVVTDGTWDWDASADALTGTAVLGALRDAFSDEPRHVDLRWAHDGDDLDLRNGRFREVVAQLAAPVHGVAKDELEGEDVRQHRRTVGLVRAVGALLVVLTVVAVVAALAAMHNAQQARRARDDSDFQRVVAQSENLKASNPQLALLLAVEARHLRDAPQSRGALQAALVQDPRFLGALSDPTTKSATSALCPLGDSHLLIADDDGTIRFVDLTTGDGMTRPVRLAPTDTGVIATLLRPASALGCAASANGKSLGVFSASGSIWSLDASTRRVRAERTVNHALNDIALAPDGNTLAVGTADGKVLVWSIDNLRAAPRTLPSGNTSVAVAFSPDDTTLASSTPRRILLWDTTSWTRRAAVDDPPSNYQTGGLIALPEPWRTIRFSPDGRSLADGRTSATRMLDLTTGTTRWTQLITHAGGLSVAFAPNGAFYTITPEFTVARYDSATGAPIGLRFPTFGIFGTLLAVSGDGSTLLTTEYGHTALDQWALDGRSAIGRRVGPPGQIPDGYSPDGRTMLTQADSASPFVSAADAWDVTTGRHLLHIPTVAFPSLLNDHTVGGYFVHLGAVDRLDLRTGRYVGPRFTARGAVFNVGSDSAGNIVVGNTDGAIVRYEPDGKQVGHPWLKLPLTLSIAISQRGLVAISTFDDLTRVYHLATGKLAYPPIPNLSDAFFSPDGNLLGGVTRVGQAVILNASTGTPTGPPIRDASSGTQSLEFGNNDTVALESTTSARLYDLHTGEPIGESFPITSGSPWLRPDGLQLATSSANGVVLWDLNPDHWEHAACQLAGRNLTHREWATYFPNSGPYRRTCPQWPAAPGQTPDTSAASNTGPSQ